MVERLNFENQEQYRETSLVDLSKILVRRRNALYIAFSLVFLAGFIFAFLSETKFRYTTIYSVGQPEKVGSKKLLDEITAAMENRFIPEFIEVFQEENGHKPPFDFSVNPPNYGVAIMLQSDATQENSRWVREAHERILKQLKEREADFVSTAKAQLQSRLEGMEILINRLQNLEDPGSALVDAYARRAQIEAELDTATQGEVLATARESANKVSGSRALVGVITIMFAVVIGIFTAFVVEFVGKVRESLKSSQDVN